MPYIHGWHTKEPHIIHCMHFATGAGVCICGGGGGRGGGGGGGGGASEPIEPDSAEVSNSSQVRPLPTHTHFPPLLHLCNCTVEPL